MLPINHMDGGIYYYYYYYCRFWSILSFMLILYHVYFIAMNEKHLPQQIRTLTFYQEPYSSFSLLNVLI